MYRPVLVSSVLSVLTAIGVICYIFLVYSDVLFSRGAILVPDTSSSRLSMGGFNPFVATASQAQALLESGALNSEKLVELHLDEIAKNDRYFRAITATPPREWTLAEARRLDTERNSGSVRGPLHGIPILIKDLVDTEPALNMSTTWGSLTLAGNHPQRNAKIIDMEWGWFRGTNLPSGWCAVTGQGQSPYVLGGYKEGDSPSGHSNPTGSSSGSAIGVAAGFAPISIGAESTGSMMMPACRAALYSIKPTIGIVPGDGCLAVSRYHDTLSPMAKSAEDIADLLDVIVDPVYVPEGGYAGMLTKSWEKVRVGVLQPEEWVFGLPFVKPVKEINDQLMAGWEEAYSLLEKHAARFERVELISLDKATANGTKDITSLAKRDFRLMLADYLAAIPDSRVHNLSDIIHFNEEHAAEELPPAANNQDNFIAVERFNISDAEYNEILRFGREMSRDRGVDKVMRDYDVNIIIAPSDSGLFLMSSLTAYPIAAVPYGYVDFEGNNRPFGLFALAAANQDALLVEFMSAWEAVAPPRRPPIKTTFP